ncbi:MAG: transglutaminase domain-containing protein [Ferruginibacter sp.]
MKPVYLKTCLQKTFLPALLMCSILANAGYRNDDEKKIVIENKKQSFLFKQAQGANPVLIKENNVTDFRSIATARMIYTEMYNDNETIDDIAVNVRNRPYRGVDIKYDYYSIKDIFYSDARICHFEIPFDETGVPAKVTLSKTHNDPRYFTRVYFTEEYFVQRKEIQFIIPKWMKCELKEYNFNNNDIKSSVTYDGKLDADVYTYIMKDLPPFSSEPNEQGMAYNFPHVLVLCKEANTASGLQTYFKTIEDQYKWCYDIVKDLTDDDAALKVQAEEITKGMTGDVNKVKALLNWVHQNIRYIAYEDGIAAFKPAKASEVMKKKYGDCKGMANLLKGLIKNIGLDARLCWIGTNHIPYDLATPSLSVHNHMIAAWLTNGKTYFLDGTETNIAFDQYAERIAGRQVLIENGDKYILTHIPQVVAEQNTQKEKRVLSIEGQNLVGTAEHIYRGEARSDMINHIMGIKRENTEKALNNYLADNNQDYVIGNLKRSDIPGVDSVLKIGYDIAFKNGASVFGNEIYLDLDFRKDFNDFIIDTAKRMHNLQLSNKLFIDEETALTIPAGYKIGTLPANLSLQNSTMDISITYKVEGNKLLYHKLLKIKQILLKKEDFGLWNKQIEQLSGKYKEQVVLAK